ncbi:butyrophilin-like protein 2 [Oreochromis niloticus]|uniref:butyrophilin-like protein 2 n=1 Tax=Oreochromis niloticus TaxID=8128 RepID=UPI000904977A|nr:butyrophilin-like protein 2 [Oreochromis niloticus]
MGCMGQSSLRLPTEGEQPQPFIVRIHYYQEKERIQRLARQKGRLEFQGKQIFIFPDYSADLARRRAAFSEVKGPLRKNDGVRSRMTFHKNHRDFHTIMTILLSINKRTIPDLYLCAVQVRTHKCKKNPSYKGRSSLFTDELKHGNISLKLTKVKPADEGRYRCYIPEKDEEVFIDLVVASSAVSSPVISLADFDKAISGVVLQCESTGWYPEPELLWLDGEGNLLSAGPTETLRGPDDLYTVSSRVTVEKRHSNNITCRVQQRNTNQSRETHIYVPGKCSL